MMWAGLGIFSGYVGCFSFVLFCLFFLMFCVRSRYNMGCLVSPRLREFIFIFERFSFVVMWKCGSLCTRWLRTSRAGMSSYFFEESHTLAEFDSGLLGKRLNRAVEFYGRMASGLRSMGMVLNAFVFLRKLPILVRMGKYLNRSPRLCLLLLILFKFYEWLVH